LLQRRPSGRDPLALFLPPPSMVRAIVVTRKLPESVEAALMSLSEPAGETAPRGRGAISKLAWRRWP